MNIGFAMCGSYCTYSEVFPIMEDLSRKHNITPILSYNAYTTDSRFGTAQEHIQKITQICGMMPLHTIVEVEPIGPKKLLDVLIIAPCTGNTLAKLAHGIADTPVTMAAKSHLRNGRPVVIAISTNDALFSSGENIGKLLAKKHYYFVPFSQDEPVKKPCSMIAHFPLIEQTADAAMKGIQLQPMILTR